MHWICSILIVFSIIGFAFPSHGAEVPILVLTPEGDWEGQSVSRFVEIRSSPEDLSPAELESQFASLPLHPASYQSHDANFGWITDFIYTRIRVSVANPTTVLLELDHSYAERIEAFVEGGSNLTLQMTGSTVAYQKRTLKSRRYVVPLNLNAGLNDIYIKILGRFTLALPVRFWTPEKFDQQQNLETLMIALAFGGVLMIGIYNLMIFASIGDRLFLAYALYIFGQCGFLMYNHGIPQFFAYQILGWQTLPSYLGGILIYIGIFFASYFTRLFYQLKPSQKSSRILRSIEVISLLAIVLSPSYPRETSMFCLVMGTVVMFFIFILTVIKLLTNRKATYLIVYFLGWLTYILGSAIALYAGNGTLETNWLTKYVQIISFVIEVACFSLAVAHKMRETHEVLEHQERISQHSYQQLAKVFFPHQIELIRQGQQVEETMPTHQAQACVLCFDIVASSKILHEGYKPFIHRFLNRCHELMIQDYSANQRVTGGYRVKDMGDGFLCSIGYPFATLKPSMAGTALDLADAIHRIFVEEALNFDYVEPLSCNMGIAMDLVNGVYTQCVPIQYDLEGRALILASRYEAARKLIKAEQKVGAGHGIYLQEKVFLSLPGDKRAKFTRIPLTTDQARSLEDPTAQALYFFELPAVSHQKHAPKAA